MEALQEKLDKAEDLLIEVYKDIASKGEISFNTSVKVTDYVINNK